MFVVMDIINYAAAFACMLETSIEMKLFQLACEWRAVLQKAGLQIISGSENYVHYICI